MEGVPHVVQIIYFDLWKFILCSNQLPIACYNTEIQIIHIFSTVLYNYIVLKPVFRIHDIFAVLRIRIHRIHMFLDLQDPDPLVRGMDPDPDPSIIKQN